MPKKLRKGIAKHLLESSIESVLMAVEIYNKPLVQFKLQSYITLMIIGWTKAFQAYFHMNGIKYFYKKRGRYIKVDGEYKSWDISKCIENIELESDIKANIIFFIKLRNKIEHRNLSSSDLELITFGECQSLLYNYELFIVKNFGDEYSLNASLSFALQFATHNTAEQERSQKRQLSRELVDIKKFINSYRNSLSDDIFQSQKYSIKFLIIPKISNTKRGDLSIEFVKAESLSEGDYAQITAIIKEKKVIKEAANVKKYKPSQVIKIIRRHFKFNESVKFNASYHHVVLCKYYKVRPFSTSTDPFETNSKYCLYDEAHNDYVYTKEWIRFLIDELSQNPIEKFNEIKAKLMRDNR